MHQRRHGAIGSRILAALLSAGLLCTLVLGSASTVQAQSPTEECAAQGLVYVDKIDSINGSGNYTSDEGFAYTVTVTDNPNPTPDSYTLAPPPASSGYYPGYTDITELPKFGVGGGLSHITICGLQAQRPTVTVPAATATVPQATSTVPVATATVPQATATVPGPTATLPPGVTPTDVPPTATLAPGVTPTATGVTVQTLPETGAHDSGPGSTQLLLVIAGTAMVLLTAALAVGQHGKRDAHD